MSLKVQGQLENMGMFVTVLQTRRAELTTSINKQTRPKM